MKTDKIALVVSLKFRAAHISHLVASYKQLSDLGYKPLCYIHPDAIAYLPEGVEYVTSLDNIPRVSLAIFWFPALTNVAAMLKLRVLRGAKILYVFHEPIESFGSYLASGNSRWWTIKFFMKYYVALSFLSISNRVILPSNKAVSLYQRGLSRFANPCYSYLPLLYDDERNADHKNTRRKYISYIGGISKDHAFDEFVDFIYAAYNANEFSEVKFLIASWRKAELTPKIREMINAGVLDVHDGRPMTNDEINDFYAQTFVIWNAYNRSTQSGVLAKSFMFGTPALVMHKNLSEFIEDCREVKAVNSNTDYKELASGIHSIISDFRHYSVNARDNFERNYLYSTHNNEMAAIIDKL